jgi:hypothetical protein
MKLGGIGMVVDRKKLTTPGTLLGDIRNATVSTVLSPTVFFFIESTILTLAIAFFIDSAAITPTISFVELRKLPAQLRVQWGSMLAWLKLIHSQVIMFLETVLMSYGEFSRLGESLQL